MCHWFFRARFLLLCFRLNNKMKITICTGAWKRPNLLDFFCRYYADLQKKFPFELVVACSEKEAMSICQAHGHTCFMVVNEPLHRKFNAAVQAAKGSDYVINIGSDDFLTEDFLRHYDGLFREGHDYITTLDWYFFDTKTKKGLYWKGYDKPHNTGKGCGAGRALSKHLLEEMNWKPWAAGYDKVLDTGMQVKLDAIPHKAHSFRLRDLGLFALDIKTEENMTPFDRWDNTTLFDGREMLDAYVPEYTAEILKLKA